MIINNAITGMFKSSLTLILCVFVASVLLFNVQASNLERAYISFERMQIDVETEMTLMFSPSTNFSSGAELTLNFLTDIGEWCLSESSMTVLGVDSSHVDMGSWSIDTELPTTSSFQATCVPGDVEGEIYDKIIVENIGELDSEVSYGLLFEKTPSFTTSSLAGDKKVLIEVNDGETQGAIEVVVNLIEADGVDLSAFVSDLSTISCTISDTNISFGTLPRDGTYVTGQHSLSVESSLVTGYYWAVFGQGDGTNAGLWKSTLPTSLIPSTGSTTINLSQNHGFGINVNSASGNIPNDFDNVSGVFGAINSGSINSRLIFYEESSASSNVNIILGARAGLANEVGEYSETLTYLCGGLY